MGKHGFITIGDTETGERFIKDSYYKVVIKMVLKRLLESYLKFEGKYLKPGLVERGPDEKRNMGLNFYGTLIVVGAFSLPITLTALDNIGSKRNFNKSTIEKKIVEGLTKWF